MDNEHQHKVFKKNEIENYQLVCVVVPIYNNFDTAKECIKRVLKFTNLQVQILVIDDGSTEGEFNKLEGMDSHRIQYIRNPQNIGLVESLNNAIEICDPKDLIILNSDVFVYEDWLENLYLEAYENDLIATVTAMADKGGIASVKVGDRNLEDASEEDFININKYLSRKPSNPQISIPVGVGHCLYVKRTALNLVGKFDLRFSPGYGEEVDFCLRCVKIGFIHVLSQKVLVRHKEGVSFGGRRKKLQIMHDKKIEDKYEFYRKYLEIFEEIKENKNNLFLNILTFISGFNVLIDGRILENRYKTGTSKVTISLIEEFAKNKSKKYNYTVITNSRHVSHEISKLGLSTIGIKELNDVIKGANKYDVLIRFDTISFQNELVDILNWAHKFCYMYLDAIAYDNPFYFKSMDNHDTLRKSHELINLFADQIYFNSRFALEQFKRIFPVNEIRENYIVFNGLNQTHQPKVKPINNEPTILNIGTSFHHKNRSYSIRLHEELIKKIPKAKLVFLGPSPNFGNSLKSDKKLVEELNLENKIEFLEWVNDHKKQELIKRADLILSTSNSEGFGLVPFEGIEFGVPSIYPKLHSFREVLSESPLYLNFLNAKQDCKILEIALTDDSARQSQLNVLVSTASQYKWQRTANMIENNIAEIFYRNHRSKLNNKFLTNLSESKEIIPKIRFINLYSNTIIRVVNKIIKISDTLKSKLPIKSKLIRAILIQLQRFLHNIKVRITFPETKFFDNSYYNRQLSERGLEKGLGFEHFRTVGWRMNLQANDWLDTSFYVNTNPDVSEAGLNPLTHYIRYGKNEGRKPNPNESTELNLIHGLNCIINIESLNKEFYSRIYMKLGDNCKITIGKIESLNTALTIVAESESEVVIGSNIKINGPVTIAVGENSRVSIGDDCLFARSTIRTGDSHKVLNKLNKSILNNSKNVNIGDRVWVAEDAQILKGATIGDDSVVGAGSVVTKTFQANQVLAGNPARVVRDNIIWEQ